MDIDILRTIVADRGELLALPQTLAEVLRLVRDEGSTADDLAAAITRDPALTAKVLRIVNSAFYDTGRRIGSMTQAVMTLGMRQITALALSTSVYRLFEGWGSSFDKLRFWRHSLEVAIASRTIAERVGLREVEEAFVAGLLHDIGLLVLEHSFPEKFARVWAEAARDNNLVDLEEDVWGTDHARVGQFLLGQWHLPESICRSVGSHHTVFVPGTRDPELKPCQVVCLANHVSRFSIAGSPRPGSGTDRENRDILQENLQLTREEIHKIEKDLFSQTIAEARYLEMDIGSVDSILLEANRLLFDQYLTVESLLKENRQMQQRIVRDQFQRVSVESLKSTRATFARNLDAEVLTMRNKAEEVRKGIEAGMVTAPAPSILHTLDDILSSIETVRSMTNELKNLSQLDAGVLSEDRKPDMPDGRAESEVGSVEERVHVG